MQLHFVQKAMLPMSEKLKENPNVYLWMLISIILKWTEVIFHTTVDPKARFYYVSPQKWGTAGSVSKLCLYEGVDLFYRLT